MSQAYDSGSEYDNDSELGEMVNELDNKEDDKEYEVDSDEEDMEGGGRARKGLRVCKRKGKGPKGKERCLEYEKRPVYCAHHGIDKRGRRHCLDYAREGSGLEGGAAKGTRRCLYTNRKTRRCGKYEGLNGHVVRHRRPAGQLTKKGLPRKKNEWNLYFGRVRHALAGSEYELSPKVIAQYYREKFPIEEVIRIAKGSGLVGGRMQHRRRMYGRGMQEMPLEF
jgi:hypothetical protein